MTPPEDSAQGTMFEKDHLKFPFSEVAAATRSDLVETMQSCDMQDSSSDWIPERHKNSLR